MLKTIGPKPGRATNHKLSHDTNKETEITNSAKWLHIRVTDLRTGQSRANVKIPAGLANFGMKMATKYAPDAIEGSDMNQMIATIQDAGETRLYKKYRILLSL